MTNANGVAINIADKDTLKDSVMISQIPPSPLINSWKALTLAWLKSFTRYDVFEGSWVKQLLTILFKGINQFLPIG